MIRDRFVVFNCSSGPVTVTLAKKSDLATLARLTSHHRRRLARNVFKIVIIPSNSSKDLVMETGLSLEDLESNEDLKKLIMANKLRILPEVSQVVPEKVVELPKEEIKEEVTEVPQEEVEKEVKEEISFIEEVVDEEELKRELLEESRRSEEELLESLLSDSDEKCDSTEELAQEEPKKRGRKPGKGNK